MKKNIVYLMILTLGLMISACSGKVMDTDKNGQESQTNSMEKVELKDIRDEVATAYKDYIPSMPYDATQIKDIFGVEESWYDEIIAEGPMISTHVDTFIAIHPTEGNLDKVQKALENYKDYLVNESMQYPMNIAKVHAASISVIDDNIYFIMLGLVDDAIEDESERLAAFEAQNQIAIDTINNMLSN